MNISDGITSTLRAQDHGHPPVVCFNECNDRAYISETTAATVRWCNNKFVFKKVPKFEDYLGSKHYEQIRKHKGGDVMCRKQHS